MKRYLSVALLSVFLFSSIGCASWVTTEFQILTADKDVLDQAQKDYEARRIPKTTCVQSLINEGKDAQAVGVQALGTYLLMKAAGSDVQAQIDNVTSQVASVAIVITKIQSLATVPCASKTSAVTPLKTFDNAGYGTRREAK